ncbi:MAG: crotonase/enoyl-CoA hydratase family protein [Pseudomonadota bacterium]
MEERVILDVQDHVAHVRMVRSDKMNALDTAMFQALIDSGDQLKNDRDVRAVVISGEGRAFCAGLDLESMSANGSGDGETETTNDQTTSGEGRLERRTHGIANFPQYASWVWREVPVPVIAALHGVALGGGCQLAMGADIRYAAPDTRLCIMEMKWGLVPDMAATPYLQNLLRDDILRELTYTNRMIEAAEALSLGLVTRICDDPLATALDTAAEIACRNPEAIRGAKRILNAAPFQNPQEILLSESREQDKIIGTPNQMEAVMANLEKRSPKFP